ncbi:uncharacterized protein LOC132727115 [Ruditapes philippinarum]|uniref:uncharacterized protein LOC132727115 n=1 Tax=Ruditapes philippinarum TaxID=129788 RepID=UPI00295B2726|nr:uncharacterized protein LOC132727115 [Ruditapes philippinarum]
MTRCAQVYNSLMNGFLRLLTALIRKSSLQNTALQFTKTVQERLLPKIGTLLESYLSFLRLKRKQKQQKQNSHNLLTLCYPLQSTSFICTIETILIKSLQIRSILSEELNVRRKKLMVILTRHIYVFKAT